MRSPVRAFIPVGLVAAAILVAACGPAAEPADQPRLLDDGADRSDHERDDDHDDHDRGDRAAPPLLREPARRLGPGRHRLLGRHPGQRSLRQRRLLAHGEGQAVSGAASVMAVQRDTGDLLPGFVANTNGIVHVVLSDGISVYVGGEFTTIDGMAESHFGQGGRGHRRRRSRASTANAPSFVSDLFACGGTKLYVVGEYGAVNGVNPHGRGPCSTRPPARVDPTFDPEADLQGQHRRHESCRYQAVPGRRLPDRSAARGPVAGRGEPDHRQGTGPGVHGRPGVRPRRDGRTRRAGVRRGGRQA